jgi:hypothetical protein
MLKQERLGSTLDSFLAEEGILEEVEAEVAKRVIALQIGREMKRLHISAWAPVGRPSIGCWTRPTRR